MLPVAAVVANCHKLSSSSNKTDLLFLNPGGLKFKTGSPWAKIKVPGNLPFPPGGCKREAAAFSPFPASRSCPPSLAGLSFSHIAPC